MSGLMIEDCPKQTMWIFSKLNKNNFNVILNVITCQFVVNANQVDCMLIIDDNMSKD